MQSMKKLNNMEHKITACMIVKDEIKVLPKTIADIKDVFAEIIIVDTGSTDGTREFIQKLEKQYENIKAYHFKWVNHFSAARNFSFSKAKTEYVTWWDADDIMTQRLAEILLGIQNNPVMYPDVLNVDTVTERDNFGNVKHSVFNNRIIKRSKFLGWKYRIHEEPQIERPYTQENLTEQFGVTVEHQKDLHNSHHYNFYVNLINDGHKFVFHDYCFFIGELLLQPKDYQDSKDCLGICRWVETNLSDFLDNNEDEFCGYVGILYDKLYEQKREWLKKGGRFYHLGKELLNYLLQKYQPNSQLCCWFADSLCDEEPIRWWLIRATALKCYNPEYRIIEPKWWTSEVERIAAEHNIKL